MAETTPVKVNGGQALRPRDPFDLFEELQQDMARLWSVVWPMAPRPVRQMAAQSTNAWIPTMDVFEKDGALVVKAELPGIKKEDIDVHLEQNDLVIRGERKTESEVKEDKFYRVERSYGSFYRRLPLGYAADPQAIKANYADGVLEITIPQPKEATKAEKKIPVN